MLKKIVKSALRKAGYQITRVGAGRAFNLYNPDYLSKICDPKTVIDVGVGYGTEALYKAFPSAYFVLIEPIEEYRDSINKILSEYSGVVHYKAVGRESGTVELDVDLDNPLLTSRLRRTNLTAQEAHRVEKRKVEMITLDGLFPSLGDLKRPLLLKIDTEGNELDVLKGAEKLLGSTDFVIAEASISKRFEGSYEFKELMAYMSDRGFELFSILYILHPEKEERPRYADIVFSRSA